MLFICIVVIVPFVLNYYYPIGTDFDCSDFKNRSQMTLVYKRAGGPQKDPYDLDANKNGVPCEIYKYNDDIQ